MNRTELIELLEIRFNEHPERHGNMKWDDVKHTLETSPNFEFLIRMEEHSFTIMEYSLITG